jgi:uncharacterized transporter YbjL
MVYQTIIEANKTGLLGMWSYVNDIVPAFTPLFLFSLFFVITIGSYYSQIRIRGFGDLIGSVSVGGIVIAVISVLMSFSPQKIIDTPIVIICIAIGVGGGAILFLQNPESND